MATSSSTAQRRNGSPVGSRSTTWLSQPPAIALIIYPLTLLIGSLYSIISPTARQYQTFPQPSPLTPTIASDLNLPPTPHPSSVNYFARKNNVFNLYFVKIGWAWTTLAFFALLLTQPFYISPLSNVRGKRITQALFRYTSVTVAWFLTTQWFFGPAIIDRTFTLTGGKCENLRSVDASVDALDELKIIFGAAACKAAGGAWYGGHDVSGHVFMLVLASAFLAFEALGASFTTINGLPADAKEKEDHEESSTEQVVIVYSPIRTWALRFAGFVIGLSWWMLLMTAIWFHTWVEKLSGLVIAIGTVYVIYFLPQSLPPWRDIVGIPGV